jgi:hypothetical protein
VLCDHDILVAKASPFGEVLSESLQIRCPMLSVDLRKNCDFLDARSCDFYHGERHMGDHVNVDHPWPTGSHPMSIMVITQDSGKDNIYFETSCGLIVHNVDGQSNTFKRIGKFNGLDSRYMFRYAITKVKIGLEIAILTGFFITITGYSAQTSRGGCNA